MNRIKAIALSLLGLAGAGALGGCYGEPYYGRGGYHQGYYRAAYVAPPPACRGVWVPAHYGHFGGFRPAHWEC